MNLIKQLMVLVCNFFSYWNFCDSRDNQFKNVKLRRKSVVAVIASFYAEFIHNEKPEKPAMATRDVSVTRVKFAPAINYDAYESPSYTRFAKSVK